ncbi:sulfurtransferase [Curtobacterium sp. RRHDQ10]|uniref:sulfurtransferase n=1 Tax=Curtobacterium phyllosphaerae TaxID=3413379 RepID=UPI003BF0EDCA
MHLVPSSPLVSTQWLADHLGSDELVVIDASVRTRGIGSATTWAPAFDDYVEDGHVPGAVFADLVDALSDPDADLPFTRPDSARFERAISALGVSNDDTVVVYDRDLGQWSARVWWLFRSFGFDQVAVLDGGYAKWRQEGRPVRSGAMSGTARERPVTTFLATEERALWADRDRVVRAVDGSEPAALVCAAPTDIVGAAPPELIPGTTTIPVQALLDADTNALLRPKALTAVLEPVLAATEVVTYCGVGTAACVDALALTVLGHERVRVYDGSLADWWREPEPLAS